MKSGFPKGTNIMPSRGHDALLEDFYVLVFNKSKQIKQ
jgi:hypothetical protein